VGVVGARGGVGGAAVQSSCGAQAYAAQCRQAGTSPFLSPPLACPTSAPVTVPVPVPVTHKNAPAATAAITATTVVSRANRQVVVRCDRAPGSVHRPACALAIRENHARRASTCDECGVSGGAARMAGRAPPSVFAVAAAATWRYWQEKAQRVLDGAGVEAAVSAGLLGEVEAAMEFVGLHDAPLHARGGLATKAAKAHGVSSALTEFLLGTARGEVRFLQGLETLPVDAAVQLSVSLSRALFSIQLEAGGEFRGQRNSALRDVVDAATGFTLDATLAQLQVLSLACEQLAAALVRDHASETLSSAARQAAGRHADPEQPTWLTAARRHLPAAQHLSGLLNAAVGVRDAAWLDAMSECIRCMVDLALCGVLARSLDVAGVEELFGPVQKLWLESAERSVTTGLRSPFNLGKHSSWSLQTMGCAMVSGASALQVACVMCAW